jgi:hypothetical protein
MHAAASFDKQLYFAELVGHSPWQSNIVIFAEMMSPKQRKMASHIRESWAHHPALLCDLAIALETVNSVKRLACLCRRSN